MTTKYAAKHTLTHPVPYRTTFKDRLPDYMQSALVDANDVENGK